MNEVEVDYEEENLETNECVYNGVFYKKVTLAPNDQHIMTHHDKILIDKRSGRAILVRRCESSQEKGGCLKKPLYVVAERKPKPFSGVLPAKFS